MKKATPTKGRLEGNNTPNEPIPTSLELLMKDSFFEYGLATLKRAIPYWKDGLAEVQRRVYWTFISEGLHNKLYKSALVVGRIMAIHPHSSTYNVLCTLSSKSISWEPLLQGQGNGPWMSKGEPYVALISSDPPAAERYTEITVSGAFKEWILPYVDESLMGMVPCEVGEGKEPSFIFSLLPLMFNTHNTGIAVAYSYQSLPRTPWEIREEILNVLDNNPVGNIYPHFPTGGKLYLKGENSYVVESHIVRKSPTLYHITSLPPHVSAQTFCEKVATKLKGVKQTQNPIKGMRDLSSGANILIEITLKRGRTITDAEAYLPIRSTLTERLITLGDDGRPETHATPEDYLRKWVDNAVNYLRGYAENRKIEAIAHYERLMLLKEVVNNPKPLIEQDMEQWEYSYPHHYKWLLGQTIRRITKMDKSVLDKQILNAKNQLQIWEERVDNPREYYKNELLCLTQLLPTYPTAAPILPYEKAPTKKKATSKKVDPKQEQALAAGVSVRTYNIWKNTYKGGDLSSSFADLLQFGKYLSSQKEATTYFKEVRGYPTRSSKAHGLGASAAGKEWVGRFKQSGNPNPGGV